MTKTHQEFMAKFDDERKQLVEAFLKAINEECPTLTETIKWNAPTFCDDSNIRATITFFDLTDFLSKRDFFKKAVKRWVEETKGL